MNTKKLEDLTSQLINTNSNNDALINILLGYCKSNLENPNNSSMFDVFVMLNHIKDYSNKTRNTIEQLNDCF